MKKVDTKKEVTLRKDGLNPQQEKFCQLYATDVEFFGNGVQSYIEAYNPDTSKPNWYKTACSVASELLTNPKVFNRINEILEETGMNDVAVDKQLSFLIHQHSDFSAKTAAIREYNKLKQRIVDKTELSGSLTLEKVEIE
jgi:phage terminase small subunit